MLQTKGRAKSSILRLLPRASAFVFVAASLFCVPHYASAAIAFDATSNNYSASETSTYTVSMTVGSGSNRFLLCATEGGFGAPPTGMTYAGNAMTLYGSASGGSIGNTTYLYYLYSPTSGTNNVVLSFSGTSDAQIFCESWSGAKQSGFPDAGDTTQTSTAAGITYTLTTVTDNDWMFSTMRSVGDGTGTASTNTTDRSSGTRYFNAGDTNGPLTPAGSKSMSWTTARSGFTIFGIVVAIAPAPATSQFNFWQFFAF